MSYYSFKFKKGKIELEVHSEDKYFVVSQFDKIYREMVEEAGIPQKSKKKKPVKKEIKQQKTEIPKVFDEEPKEKTVSETIEKTQPVEEETEAEEEIKPIAETKKEVSDDNLDLEEKKVSGGTEPLEEEMSVSTEPKIQETPEPKEESVPTEDDLEQVSEIKEALPNKTSIENDFQKIIEEKLNETAETEEEVSEEADVEEKETITFYEKTDAEVKTDEIDSEEKELAEILRKNFEEKEEEPLEGEKAKNPAKVYDILQEKLSSLPEEEKTRLKLNAEQASGKKETPLAFKFKDLDDLLYLKKPQTKLDYLLITAYFLKEKEDKEKYSLKQINSKIVPHIKEPIDHSMIHEAVAHSYIEVIPDYTGTSDITEYAITEEGIDYILNEL